MTTVTASYKSVSPWWRTGVLLAMILGFSVLIGMTVSAYQVAPPIPEKIVAAGGTSVFTREDIRAGQQVFLKYGLMENGTIWGHGAYLGPETIDGGGSMEISQREAGFPSCPICLAGGTLIDTPRGAVPVEDLEVGDPVWTQDEAGRRVIGFVLRTGHVKIPSTHQMIHVILNDGRELWASPGHPAADGRKLGHLKTGDRLDGAQIISLEKVPYHQAFTFDLLPSGATGYYWANGILIGSTLKSP